MFRTFLIRIFEQKIRKNKWWNLEKMPKNRFFRHISGIFGRKNMFFEKSGSVIFQILPFCISVPNYVKKYKVQLDIQEMPFFGRKSAVPETFRKFRLQKSVFLTNEPCFMVDIVINNVFVWKNTKNIRNWWKSAKTAISGIFYENLQKRRFPAFSAGKNFF